MKWLQWSFFDGKKGVGGVEVHMRCLARELEKRGIDAFISDSAADLRGSWDVIHTHGAGLHIFSEIKEHVLEKFRGYSRPVWVHTLHGYTHQRMLACREFAWAGGYRGIARELTGSLGADVVLAIHPNLDLRLFEMIGKRTAVCGNGWDAGASESAQTLPAAVEERIRSRMGDSKFWVFVGRGADPVKGVPRLLEAVKRIPDFRLVMIPGEGNETNQRVVSTGLMTPGQMRPLLNAADGLILASYHEGLPLVILEALGQGTPVISTNVGGIKTLSDNLQGFIRIKDASVPSIERALEQSESLPRDENARQARAHHNRQVLRSWKDVAATVFEAVRPLL
jgi:glycosyltransferase involved in cell wall biosynthesis